MAEGETDDFARRISEECFGVDLLKFPPGDRDADANGPIVGAY